MHFKVHTKNTVNGRSNSVYKCFETLRMHLTNIIPKRNVHYVACNRNYRLITSPLGSSYFPQPLLTLQQHAAHSHTHMHANTKRKTALCVLCKIDKRIHTHTHLHMVYDG